MKFLQKGMPMDKGKNVRNLQTLKGIVGEELFGVIVESLTGENIYFNKRMIHPSKEERDAAIKKDYIYGMELSEIAEKYGLKISSLYKIIEQRV